MPLPRPLATDNHRVKVGLSNNDLHRLLCQNETVPVQVGEVVAVAVVVVVVVVVEVMLRTCFLTTVKEKAGAGGVGEGAMQVLKGGRGAQMRRNRVVLLPLPPPSTSLRPL